MQPAQARILKKYKETGEGVLGFLKPQSVPKKSFPPSAGHTLSGFTPKKVQILRKVWRAGGFRFLGTF